MTHSSFRRYTWDQIHEVHDRGIFFDTNVLLMIFRSDQHVYPRANKYFKIFAKILARRMKIFVNEIVLSEFYYAAFKSEREMSNFSSVKAFRGSETGIQARESIFRDIRALLQQLTYIPSNLSLPEITNQFTVDFLDFNDKLIAETCRKNNFVLVTDDADYKDTEIDLLSANSVLFA